MAHIFSRQRRSDYAPLADKKISKHVDRLIKSGEYIQASQVYEVQGMLREAVAVLEQHGLALQGANLLVKHRHVKRGVEILIRHKHYLQAVQVCIRHRMYDKAGEIYASQGYHSQAAECYVKAHRTFLAASCYEKAQKYLLAGRYYGYSSKLEHSVACYMRYVKMHPNLEGVTNQDRHIVALCLQENHSALEQLCRYLHYSSYIIPVINSLFRKNEMKLFGYVIQFARFGDLKAYVREISLTSEAARVIARTFANTDKAKLSGHIFERNGEYELAAESFVHVGEKARAAALFCKAGKDARARALFGDTQMVVADHSTRIVVEEGKDFHTDINMMLEDSSLGELPVGSSADTQKGKHQIGAVDASGVMKQHSRLNPDPCQEPHSLVQNFYLSSLFLKLSRRECDVIWQYGKVLTVPAGGELCEEGSHYEGCYIVLKGALQDHLYRRRLSEAALCGERTLLCGVTEEPVHLSAITECVVFFLSCKRFERAAKKHGSIIYKVLQSLASGVIAELEEEHAVGSGQRAVSSS